MFEVVLEHIVYLNLLSLRCLLLLPLVVLEHIVYLNTKRRK